METKKEVPACLMCICALAALWVCFDLGFATAIVHHRACNMHAPR